MEVVIEIPDDAYKKLCSCGYVSSDLNIISTIKNGTPLPKHATNGEVIKALFPNGKYAECKNVIALHTQFFGITCFDKEWWNSSYKKEGDSE